MLSNREIHARKTKCCCDSRTGRRGAFRKQYSSRAGFSKKKPLRSDVIRVFCEHFRPGWIRLRLQDQNLDAR